MTDRPLKIAYLCDITPLDSNLYSGGNTRIYRALQRHAGDVTIISNSWHLAEPLRRLMHMLPDKFNLRLRWRLHLLLGPLIARGVRREVLAGGYDVLFCAYSIQSLAGLGRFPSVLTVFTTDATPTTYKRSVISDVYGSFLSLSRYLDPWITRQEARILDHTDLLFLPTPWLQGMVKDTFGIADESVRVISWGANVDYIDPPENRASLRSDEQIELLFVGRDWFAKGGPIALDVLKALQAQGLKARLTILGCTPYGVQQSDSIKVVHQLDKYNEQDMERFSTLFCNTHFLINPSTESFGFAFCEAAAYGLPSLGYHIGGVPIRDGLSGHALPPESSAADFAAVISKYLEDPNAYDALRKTARIEYEERLNWDVWGKAVAQQMNAALGKAVSP